MGAPLLLALALCVAPARASDGPMLDVVSRRVIDPSAYIYPGFSIPVKPALARAPMITAPLTLLVEDGSPWAAPGRLETALGKVSAILAQCRVSLGPAEVHAVRWTAEGLRRLNATTGLVKLTVMSEPRLPQSRPLGFLFGRRSVPSTASAYNASSVRDLTPYFPGADRLLNTFWMTYDQEDRSQPKPDEQPNYSTSAHELVHLYGDLGHTDDEPNLMSTKERTTQPRSKSADLNDAQCLEVRKLHGLP